MSALTPTHSSHVPLHISQPEIPVLKLVGEFRVIHAEAMQNSRMQIVHLDRIADDVVIEVVDSTTHHPDAEAARMVVAPPTLPRNQDSAENVVGQIRLADRKSDSATAMCRQRPSRARILAKRQSHPGCPA
jgi:hypothetical protein